MIHVKTKNAHFALWMVSGLLSTRLKFKTMCSSHFIFTYFHYTSLLQAHFLENGRTSKDGAKTISKPWPSPFRSGLLAHNFPFSTIRGKRDERVQETITLNSNFLDDLLLWRVIKLCRQQVFQDKSLTQHPTTSTACQHGHSHPDSYADAT